MKGSFDSKAGKKGFNPGTLIFVAVIVISVVIVVLKNKRQYEPVVAGKPAIDFFLVDLDGKLRRLDEFKGKVIFLNFWATWCKPCEDEMPSMQMLHETLKDRPFEIVAVSVDKDDVSVVKEFVKRHNITFTVLHDRKGKIKDAYKTTGVPETFIIDQNGIIAEKIWGPRDWTRHENLITIFKLLENGPAPAESYGS